MTIVESQAPAIAATTSRPGHDGPPERPSSSARGSLVRRVWRGREADPAWVRPVLLVLLAFTAATYLVGLSASGWANDFYSGAVQAATHSWKAFFFGSTDAGNAISVDKPPASLWVMDLSARIFGLSSWSVLAPQALEGVASVGLLYLTVRRTWSAGVGLLAGFLLATTPAAVVMFRFNNPDALLVLVLVGSAYATLRAVQSGRSGWLVLAGTLVGLGFTTKMLQAFLVVPAIAGVYLVAGPPRLRTRLVQLVGAGAALAVSSAWWVVAVQLTPASDRPYMGGSLHNSPLDLIFGYNGLGRLSGTEKGSVGFTSASSSGAGNPDVFRMFNHEFGGNIAWLLPAAVIALAVGLGLHRHRSRTDAKRASFVLWGGWLIVTAGAFSLGKGIIHPYYSIALAPPIAALVASGVGLLLARRAELWARAVLAIAVVATVGTAAVVVGEASGSATALAPLAGLVAVLLAGSVLVAPRLRRPVRRVSIGLIVLVCMGGPMLGTLIAATTPQHTAVPGVGGTAELADSQAVGWSNWLLEGTRPSQPIVRLLDTGAGRFTWAAAATGSERATSYQLATGHPVMAVGGFNGTDPAPTLASFRQDVAERRVHWFIAGTPRQWLGGSDAAAIATWVERSFAETTVSGVRFFDLTNPLPTSRPVS